MDTKTQKVLHKHTLDYLRAYGKRVLLRVDYNVPIKNGKILDDTRMQESLQTIHEILAQKPKQLIIVAHLGRPDGIQKDLSLHPIKDHLEKLLQEDVQLALDVQHIAKTYRIVLLENIRFFAGEEKNSPEFAKKLASCADVFVNDAFGVSHRKAASTCAITKYLPSFIGRLMQKEVSMLSRVTSPTKPLITVVGFAKIEDKLILMKRLLELSEFVLIGGAVAFTFLAAQGKPIGKSLHEPKLIPLAKKLLTQYGSKIILPLDVICAKTPTHPQVHVKEIKQLEHDDIGFDIGPRTVTVFTRYIKHAKTIFWNGPVGLFEISPFDEGTNMIARAIAGTRATSIIGGGDTISAIQKSGFAKKMTHLSTGGGASLAVIEGTLPAISAITLAKNS